MEQTKAITVKSVIGAGIPTGVKTVEDRNLRRQPPSSTGGSLGRDTSPRPPTAKMDGTGMKFLRIGVSSMNSSKRLPEMARVVVRTRARRRVDCITS